MDTSLGITLNPPPFSNFLDFGGGGGIERIFENLKPPPKNRRLRRASCGYVKFTNINLPIIVFGSKVFLNLKNNFFDIKGKLSLTLE